MGDAVRSHVHKIDPFKAALFKLTSHLWVCYNCAAQRKDPQVITLWEGTPGYRGRCQTCKLPGQRLGLLAL